MLELRDPVSSASHLLTAAWAVFATLIMLRLTKGRPLRRLAVAVYGASMIALFLASGTFHGLHYHGDEHQRRFFQKIDQSAIYCLIAGTYTPVLVLLAGAWRVWFLRLVWALAIAGVSCMWLLPKAPHAVIVGIYLFLGWVGILPLPLYYRAVGWRGMNWVWLGAVLYSIGAACELAQWPVIIPGVVQAHEVLHICDAIANMAFFMFVVRYVIPYRAPVTRETAPVPAPEAATPLFPAPRGSMNAS